MTLCHRCRAELSGTYPPKIDPTALRPTPRRLLGILWKQYDSWVTAATLSQVWGAQPPRAATLRTQIWDLRRALAGTPYFVENRVGLGYRLGRYR